MKSIGVKILISCILTVGISLFTLGGFACLMSYNASRGLAEESLTSSVQVASERVEWEMTSYVNVVKQLGLFKRLSDPSTPLEDKLHILNQSKQQFGLQEIMIINEDGSCSDGNNYADREYFQNAMKGETTITEPTVSTAARSTRHTRPSRARTAGRLSYTRPAATLWTAPTAR